MTLALKSSGVRVGVSPLSAVTISADHKALEFLLHEEGAAADILPVSGNAGLTALGAGIDVNGVTTNYWTTPPFWTPDGTQVYSTTDADVQNWFDLSQIAAAGEDLFCVFRLSFTASSTLSGEETIFDNGVTGASGGFTIIFAITRSWYVSYAPIGGGQVAYAASNFSSLNNQDILCGVYFDLQSATPRVYLSRNGDVTAEQSSDLPVPLPAKDATKSVVFFAKRNDFITKLGAGGSGMKVSELRFVRSAGSAYDLWYSTMAEMNRNQHEPKVRALA